VDFIADRRAPTPSAAAELVAPDAAELRTGVDAASGRLLATLQHALDGAGDELERLFDRRVVRDVLGSVEQGGQEVDDAAQRLAELAATGVQLDEEEGLGDLVARLADPLARQLDDAEHLLPRLEGDLLHGARAGYESVVAELGARERELTARDPRAPKKLGFALVWDKEGQLVRDAEQVKPGDQLRVEVREGEMDVKRLPES